MQVQTNPWKQSAALAVALMCGTGAVQAQGVLPTTGTILAADGKLVPTLGGETFGGTGVFDFPVVDDAGQVMFRGRMQGFSATNGGNDRAIFRGTTAANLTIQARAGDPAPGLPGLIMQGATGLSGVGASPRLSPDGRVLFSTNLRDLVNPLPETTNSALLGGVVGSFGVLVREGDATPGAGGSTMSSAFVNVDPTASGINSQGRVLFQSLTAGGDTVTTPLSNNRVWVTGTPGSLELVVRTADGIPGSPGTLISSLGLGAQMNSTGQVAHTAGLSTTVGATPATAANDRIVLVYTPGSPGSNAIIVREGDAAPGTSSATFNRSNNSWLPDIGLNAFNSSGEVAAWWELFNGDVVGTTNNAALYRASASGATKIMRKGDVAPGTGGATFSAVGTSNLFLNNAGRVAFQGTLLAGSGVPVVTAANDTGVWVGNELGLTLIMREGQSAPGLINGEIVDNMGGFQHFQFNDLGQVLFQANIISSTAVPPVTAALYSWDPVLGVTLQMTTNDLFETQPGVFKAASSWAGTQVNNCNASALSFNAAGKFAIVLFMLDGTSAIVSGSVAVGTARSSFCFGDGSDTACPCSNVGLTGRGCNNTAASGGATLTCSGQASISNDSLVLNGNFAVPFGSGLFYQGNTTANPTAPFGVAYGNGLRCVGGVIARLEVVNPADVTGASSTTVQVHTLGAITSPGTYYYQLWYRDTPNFGLCTGGFNFSNAISLVWTP